MVKIIIREIVNLSICFTKVFNNLIFNANQINK